MGLLNSSLMKLAYHKPHFHVIKNFYHSEISSKQFWIEHISSLINLRSSKIGAVCSRIETPAVNRTTSFLVTFFFVQLKYFSKTLALVLKKYKIYSCYLQELLVFYGLWFSVDTSTTLEKLFILKVCVLRLKALNREKQNLCASSSCNFRWFVVVYCWTFRLSSSK